MRYLEELKEFKGSFHCEKSLEKQFEELAKYFLTKGYFLVNGDRKVYICDVEFYYHEEEGAIKDYAMYHRNNRDKNNPEPSYFELGQFNAHASGIDITFENEDKKYRAGMLIRGFKIKGVEAPNKKRYDPRSTYFYEALLNHCAKPGQMFTIEWVVKDDHPYKDEKFLQATRINIVKYHQQGENIGRKIENPHGSKKYIPCDRQWRFHCAK